MVRYHAAEIDAIALHEHSRQFGCTIPSTEVIVPSALTLTHLNTDGVPVSRLGTGMPARLIERKILHNHELIHREVPAAIGESATTERAGVLHGS